MNQQPQHRGELISNAEFGALPQSLNLQFNQIPQVTHMQVKTLEELRQKHGHFYHLLIVSFGHVPFLPCVCHLQIPTL